MLGALYALISAGSFAYNNVATRRGVVHGTVFQAMVITVPMGVVLFGLAAYLAGSLGQVWRFSAGALGWFALAGFAHFVFGRYCNYRAIAAIGTNLASPLQQWEVLVTLTLAVVFLHEKIGPLELIAIALLVAGPALANRIEASRRPSSAGAAAAPVQVAPVQVTPVQAAPMVAKPVFAPRYAEGYLFAFLTIFGYGSSPILIKAGLQAGSVGDSLAGGLVSYTAASAVILLAMVALGKVEHMITIRREPLSWFMLAGVLVFVSHMFRYMALALAPASVVSPILRMQSLFRIYFSWLMAREYEVFSANVVLGTVVSLAGAVLLGLRSDWLLSVLPLPEAVRTVLGWHWP